MSVIKYTRPASDPVEERLQLLERAVNASTSGIIITDARLPDNPIIYLNARFGQMTGYSAEEILGLNCRFLQGNDRDQPDIIQLRKAIKAGHECNVVLRNYRKDGSLFWNQLRLAPITDDTGKVSHFIGVLNDISEYHLTEEKLRESEAKLKAIFDSSLQMFMLIDPEHRIQAANRMTQEAAVKLWGREIKEGDSIYNFVHSWEIDEFDTDIDRSLGGGSVKLEKSMKGKDGSDNWFEFHYTPARDNLDQIIGVCLTILDINDRMQVEAALRLSEEKFRHSQKMESVGRLAGGIAHDFNNMLTAILGYAQLIQDELPSDSPLQAEIAEIEKAGQRSASLTRQLLAFSRQQVLQPLSLNLNEIIRDIERMLLRILGEDISVTLNLDAKLKLIYADPTQIQQIIMNLVVNARDAMPTGGKLVITSANCDRQFSSPADSAETLYTTPCIMLSVADNGCGMDSFTQAHIFEPFFTTKEQGKGTGLGLSTVYGIIQQSGGYIEVESRPEYGTKFNIFLPAIVEPVEEIKPPIAVIDSHFGSETILLVEDEEMLRDLARRILQMHGYEVLEARNGAEALKLAKQYHASIDLLLTDMVMPQLSGWELASRLKRLRPNIHILYMSGYTHNSKEMEEALQLSQEFIQKPFTLKNLTAKIRQVLENPANKN